MKFKPELDEILKKMNIYLARPLLFVCRTNVMRWPDEMASLVIVLPLDGAVYWWRFALIKTRIKEKMKKTQYLLHANITSFTVYGNGY